MQAQSVLTFNRQPSIPTVETLEARRMMSASVVGSVTIHSVLSGKPVVQKPHPGKPNPPHHKAPKHPATKPKKSTNTSPPVVTSPPASTPPVTTQSPEPPIAGNWQMSFDDEFNGTTLNPVWHTAQWWDSASTVVGKGELEAYDSTGVSVSNGQLHLTARADTQYGVPYVSGLVMTGGYRYATAPQQTFSFQYGYMQVSAKIPQGQGLWPAIWMMPASYQDSDGEIDVMEALGSDTTKAYYTVHHLALNESQQFTSTGADLSAGFHTYGVDWEPDHITWYLDGVAVGTCTNPSLIPHEPMYPIMNLAVGGTWGGPPSSTTQFPASMDVDYIRVWQSPAA